MKTFLLLTRDAFGNCHGAALIRAFRNLFLLGAIGLPIISFAQGPILSGEAPTGEISPAGNFDEWTFSANAEDSVVVSVGEVVDSGGGFVPRIRVFAPGGSLVDSASFGSGVRLYLSPQQIVQSGTYTIRVDDGGSGGDGTGTYQLFLAKVPGSSVVPSGDQGGALVNGGNFQGTITIADLDIWTFTANAGDSIQLGIAETADNNNFRPEVCLFQPDGTRVGCSEGLTAGRITLDDATQTGTYTVIVEDGAVGGTDAAEDTGDYQLHFIKVPGGFVVPAGDDGGALISGGNRQGTIHLSDLDAWTFVAYKGSNIQLGLEELLDNGGFTPLMRLYRPDGSFYTSDSGATNAQILITSADQSGTYTVVIEDAANGGTDGPEDTGEYRLLYSRSFDPPRADFNGDNNPDWVLQRPSSGQLGIWLMNDAMRISFKSPPPLPAGWTLIDSDQFGGGANSADFLIFNPTSLRTAIYFMNGAIRLSNVYGPTLPPGWTLLLSQDFNNDAQPDLLIYQPSTRKTAIWYLNGADHAGGVYGPTLPSSNWQIVAAADFNRDERADLLLWNAGLRRTVIWYLNGASVIDTAYGPDTPVNWKPVIVDDFNRDGKPDLVLWNSLSHSIVIWHLNNNLFQSQTIGPAVPAGWVPSAPR